MHITQFTKPSPMAVMTKTIKLGPDGKPRQTAPHAACGAARRVSTTS